MSGYTFLSQKQVILGDLNVLNASQAFTVFIILTHRGITLSPG